VVKPTEPDLKVYDVVGHSGEVEEKDKNNSHKELHEMFWL
jgi:hypothetical protein